MDKLILIFGTFNPVTNAHLQMGIIAKDLHPDAKIIYIPSRSRFLETWKGMGKRSILDAQTRVELLRRSCEPYGFYVDDLEISTDISGKTYDTLKAIRAKYHTDDIYICMGTDKVGELHTWYHGEDLIRENKYIIISRDNNSLADVFSEVALKYKKNFTEVKNSTYSGVSATQIREAYINGRLFEVKDSLPTVTYDFLKNNTGVYS